MGRCFGPEMNVEASHSVSPVGRKVDEPGQQLAEQRVDLDPGDVRAQAEVRSPPPKATWTFGVRARSSWSAVGPNASGSRLAEP